LINTLPVDGREIISNVQYNIIQQMLLWTKEQHKYSEMFMRKTYVEVVKNIGVANMKSKENIWKSEDDGIKYKQKVFKGGVLQF